MKIEIKNRMKPCLIFSLAIMLIALVMTLTGHGLNLGVDFTGGTLMTYNMGSEFDTNDISAVLTANGISDAQIAKVGQDNEVQIRISDKDNTDSLRSELEKSLSAILQDRLRRFFRLGKVFVGSLVLRWVCAFLRKRLCRLSAGQFDQETQIALQSGRDRLIAQIISFPAILIQTRIGQIPVADVIFTHAAQLCIFAQFMIPVCEQHGRTSIAI